MCRFVNKAGEKCQRKARDPYFMYGGFCLEHCKMTQEERAARAEARKNRKAQQERDAFNDTLVGRYLRRTDPEQYAILLATHTWEQERWKREWDYHHNSEWRYPTPGFAKKNCGAKN